MSCSIREQRMTGLSSVDGDEASVAEILDELRTTPFLTDKRVVVVRKADGFVSKHRDILEKYFEKPAATGVLVLTVSTWDARTRLAKMLPKVGTLIELTPPPRWKLPEHLMQHAAAKHKVKLNKDAAEMLVELIGEELTQLYNEVEKLTLFAHGRAGDSPRSRGGPDGPPPHLRRVRSDRRRHRRQRGPGRGPAAQHVRGGQEHRVLRRRGVRLPPAADVPGQGPAGKEDQPRRDRQATAHLEQQGSLLRPASAGLARRRSPPFWRSWRPSTTPPRPAKARPRSSSSNWS